MGTAEAYFRARIGVAHDAFAALAAHDVRIIIRGLDITGLRERYVWPNPPHSVVLEHLLEQINDHAKQHNDLALVIADEIHQADEYRKNLWRYQRTTTGGYRARQLDRIVDTIHFAPSSASRLLQAADMIVYLYRRLKWGQASDERAARETQAMWDRIEPKVRHDWCWCP